MTCPKCLKNDIIIVGNHYICNNPECEQKEGKKIQFTITEDKKIKFPYNQIFVNRLKREFYKAEYLQLESVGNIST